MYFVFQLLCDEETDAIIRFLAEQTGADKTDFVVLERTETNITIALNNTLPQSNETNYANGTNVKEGKLCELTLRVDNESVSLNVQQIPREKLEEVGVLSMRASPEDPLQRSAPPDEGPHYLLYGLGLLGLLLLCCCCIFLITAWRKRKNSKSFDMKRNEEFFFFSPGKHTKRFDAIGEMDASELLAMPAGIDAELDDPFLMQMAPPEEAQAKPPKKGRSLSTKKDLGPVDPTDL